MFWNSLIAPINKSYNIIVEGNQPGLSLFIKTLPMKTQNFLFKVYIKVCIIGQTVEIFRGSRELGLTWGEEVEKLQRQSLDFKFRTQYLDVEKNCINLLY